MSTETGQTKARHSRGIFERPKGSGICWIRYADASGRLRREKAGTRGMAAKLYQKRKTEALQGRKLPESLRRRDATFSELVTDALAYSKRQKRSYYDDCYRLEKVRNGSVALQQAPSGPAISRQSSNLCHRILPRQPSTASAP